MPRRMIESPENKAIRVAIARSLAWDAYKLGLSSIKEYEVYQRELKQQAMDRIFGHK